MALQLFSVHCASNKVHHKPFTKRAIYTSQRCFISLRVCCPGSNQATGCKRGFSRVTSSLSDQRAGRQRIREISIATRLKLAMLNRALNNVYSDCSLMVYLMLLSGCDAPSSKHRQSPKSDYLNRSGALTQHAIGEKH
ncbi:uncharacterized protein BO97DRAFT_279252 [Aspergillus homomorphus CBS 101889]|uniref:Uncharacterized protein n=1 Tax=Aspergillus homomorphus (strain CBS 101889) TaxID=1450537 RepID=A0A395HH06_ASPHC|nr:hypothetical protein BO97DRAFT_279252 [Aspergillus homomorphus CBS 101889]RAL06779.1 hypothetical protein BO97DRAFT_279252 [Aspergillus homomorphus CBS 101889]